MNTDGRQGSCPVYGQGPTKEMIEKAGVKGNLQQSSHVQTFAQYNIQIYCNLEALCCLFPLFLQSYLYNIIYYEKVSFIHLHFSNCRIL